MNRLPLGLILLCVGCNTVSETVTSFTDTVTETFVGSEPRHLRRTALEWAADLVSETPRFRREAAVALGALGTDAAPAIPALLDVLAKGREADRARVAEALGKVGRGDGEVIPALMKTLDAESWKVRRTAALALGELRANVAVPDLLALLLHDSVRWVRRSAAVALGAVGEPACGPLLALLDDADPRVTERAARALGYVGPAALPAVPRLISCLDSRKVAQFACKALGAIGPAAGDAAEPLAAVMVDLGRPLWTRRRAGRALGAIGPAAVAPLIWCLEEKDPDTRRFACLALAALGSDAAPAAGPLCALLGVDDEHERLRTAASLALERIGEQAVPLVVEAMEGADEARRLWAVHTLARMGNDAKEAVPALRRLLMPSNRTPGLWSRQRAVQAVAAMGPYARKAAPALGGLLADWPQVEWLIHADVAEALGAIGPSAGLAAAPLHGLLDDARKDVREAAKKALAEVGKSAVAAPAE